MVQDQLTIHDACSEAVYNHDQLTSWKNVIPYAGTKRDIVVITRPHGSLTASVTTKTVEHKQQINSLSAVY